VAFGEVATGQDFSNTVTLDHEGAFNGFVRENDAGVGEDGWIHGNEKLGLLQNFRPQ